MKEKRDINACDLSVADRGALQDVTLAISNGQAGREEEEDTGEGGKVVRGKGRKGEGKRTASISDVCWVQ